MKRLTDRGTAEVLKRNAEGLMSKGFDVPIDDLRYIKLADYENIVERLERQRYQENRGAGMNEEERKEQTFVNYDPDDYYE